MKKGVKVPYKQQMSDSDCGAACLAMVAAFHGHDVPVHRARLIAEEYGPPQSTRSLIKAARSLGFEASLVAADLESVKGLALPCILFWEFSHFVVLEQVSDSAYTICDPSVGRRRVSLYEFNLLFTGIGIQLVPTQKLVQNYKETNKQFRRFIGGAFRSGKVPGYLAGVVALAASLQFFSLVPPLVTMYVVDTLMPADLPHYMSFLFVLMLQLGLCVGVLSYFRSRLIIKISYAIDHALINGYLTHTLSLPMKYFLDRSTPELQSRMNSNTVIRNALSSHTASGFLDLIFGFGYLAVLTVASPALAMATVCIGFFYVLAYSVTRSALRDNISVEMRGQAECSAFVSEVLNGITTVKSAGGTSAISDRWSRKLNNYLRASQDRSRTDAVSDALTSVLKATGPLVLFWVAAQLYFTGSLTLGQVLAANTVALMALVPISGLISSLNHMQLIRTHVIRFSEAWLHDPEPSEGIECPNLAEQGEIRFSDVSFRYAESETSSLNSVNLSLPLGKRIGIVGPSGSGKSTLVSLLLGYQNPTSGMVLVNGIDLKHIDPASLRSQISHVPQEGFLFNSSIKENIAFGHKEITLSDIENACALAMIKADIDAMPMGLETRIGEFGVRLSGGQRQRICIARSLAKKAPMLVLDEATSSLDSLTENAVSQNAASLKNTQVVVSHRFGTIRDCDQIIVLSGGSVESIGTHEELLLTNKFYRTCSENQGAVECGLVENLSAQMSGYA